MKYGIIQKLGLKAKYGLKAYPKKNLIKKHCTTINILVLESIII